MNPGHHAPSEQQDLSLEVAMGQMLRAGVLLAALIVFVGGILYLRHTGARVPDYHHFHATAPHLRSLRGTLGGVWQGDSQSIIRLGLLVLIATPIGRVVFALFGFGVERDWLYTIISAIVLAVLFFSLFQKT